MIPYLPYIKIGAIALAAATLFGSGYHVRGISCKTAADAAQAARLQAVINQLDENARLASADHAHLQGVIDRYDAIKDIPEPATVGTARRVFLLAASPGSCDVPKAGAVAGGTEASTPVAIGPSPIERALNDYIGACSADSAQMNAMIELAP